VAEYASSKLGNGLTEMDTMTGYSEHSLAKVQPLSMESAQLSLSCVWVFAAQLATWIDVSFKLSFKSMENVSSARWRGKMITRGKFGRCIYGVFVDTWGRNKAGVRRG